MTPQQLKVADVLKEIDLRFKSGNDVPVTSTRLTKEEWLLIKDVLLNKTKQEVK